MKKRGPAEFPGRLTGEVVLHTDHYDLNEKAEQQERERVGRTSALVEMVAPATYGFLRMREAAPRSA
jgi:hypothetical protein